MPYIGLDHSTTALKIAILQADDSIDTFAIERIPDDPNEWSLIDCLSRRIDLDEIEMVATGYSYGDNLDSIVEISDTDNRGVVDHMGAGHGFGTGTKAFDELQRSRIPTVVYPGINDNLETLHSYFTELSMITGADTFAMTRYAQDLLDEPQCSFIAASVSSSTMATVVKEGRLTGAFHWIGLVHGVIDPEILRQLDAGDVQPRNAYMKAGMLARRDKTFEDVKGVPSEELLNRTCDAVRHVVYGLLPFSGGPDELDGIILSGRLNDVKSPVDVPNRLSDAFRELQRPYFCRKHSTAIGAAMIARDVAAGKNDVLGVPVSYHP